jgi:hypothetical protein
MNTKTTATEFLFEKLWETPKDKLDWNAIFKVAKQMEQYQIEEAWDSAYGGDSNHDGEQYYKEQYDK